MSFAASGRDTLLIMPRPCLSGSKKLRSRAFCWCIIFYCTSNSSFRILKKTWDFFSKWYYFHNLLKVISFQKNIFSRFFKYSDRMVASTVTNDTSAESSWSQLLGARQTRAWHDQEGVTPTFRKGHWKKKQIWRSKFRMQKKKFLMQFLIFFCYELIVCPLIFKSNKVYFASSLIAKPNLDNF